MNEDVDIEPSTMGMILQVTAFGFYTATVEPEQPDKKHPEAVGDPNDGP